MLISTLDGISIYLYARDHNPPHFHALFAEYEALIEIQTLTVWRGKLPTKQLKKVLLWAADKQDMLLAEFASLQKSR